MPTIAIASSGCIIQLGGTSRTTAIIVASFGAFRVDRLARCSRRPYPLPTAYCLLRFGFVWRVSRYVRAIAILELPLYCVVYIYGPLSSVEIVHNFFCCFVLPESWVRFAKSGSSAVFGAGGRVIDCLLPTVKLASFGNYLVGDDSGPSLLFRRFFVLVLLNPCTGD